MKLIPLEEIAEIQLGKMLSPKAKLGESPFPYLRNQNVQWGRIDLQDLALMDFSTRECDKFELRFGDLLVCEGGEPGRCAVWEQSEMVCYYQKALHRVRPREGMADSEFLSLWIRYQAHIGSFEDKNAKTTISHLPLVRLQQLQVPAIPIVTQRRTAAQLKAQLTTVEEARQAAQMQVEEAEQLRRCFQKQVMAELETASRVPLGDLLLGIEAGKSIQTLERLATEDEPAVLKVSAVSWGEFRPHEAKAVPPRYISHKRHRVRRDDLLISRANTLELVGAAVRVDRDYPNRLLSDKTLRLLVDEARIYPGYLMHILRMPEARAHIQLNATGTSDSMRNISQDTLRATPIPLPALAIQGTIAKCMQGVDALIKDIRVAVTNQLIDINLLPSRLLAQAFEDTDHATN